ncbi:SIS domain-containing protein [Candidatus Parcubacteria bacterium]|nr:SIS domain-containing protein [Candidatus Parcubacteria bacterium]
MQVKNIETIKTFPHSMFKEIFEQPQVIKNIIGEYVDKKRKEVIFNDPDKILKKLKKINRIILLGCGTSYHAALSGKYMFSEYLGIEAEIDLADEFIARKVKTDSKTLVITISQSGKTADIIRAVRLVRKQKSFVLSLTNALNSKLDWLDNFTLYNQAGEEKALAATKTYTSQILLFILITLYLGKLQKKITPMLRIKIINGIIRLPKKINQILKQNVNLQIVANKYYKLDDLLILGKNYQYASALEAGLKLKETTYMHAESFALGEFLHGPVAISGKKRPCLVFAPLGKNYKEAKEMIKKLKKLKKKVIVITTQGNRQLIRIADKIIYTPKTLNLFNPILTIIPIQILAYHIAVLKGINPDRPRNLNKYVI